MPACLLSSRHLFPSPTASISWSEEKDEPSHVDPMLMTSGDGEGRHDRDGKKEVLKAWKEGVRLTWTVEKVPQ